MKKDSLVIMLYHRDTKKVLLLQAVAGHGNLDQHPIHRLAKKLIIKSPRHGRTHYRMKYQFSKTTLKGSYWTGGHGVYKKDLP